MDFWQEKAFRFDDDVVPFLKSAGIFDRSVLIEPSERAMGGIFMLHGAGFTLFGADWPDNSIGMPVTDQPDAVYGRWVAKDYERIFRDRKPRALRVEAKIRSYPGHTPRRSYACMRLPWTAGSSPLILTASVLIN
jgi:hypothetical protein